MNIFFIFVLISSLPGLGITQDRPKVNLLEFSFDSEDKRDKSLKQRIQNKIMEKLKRSQRIAKVEFVSHTVLEILSKHGERGYYKRRGIRYIVKGEMENISEDQIWMKIVLLDMKAEGEEKEKFRRERTLKKEMKTMDYWFDKVSKNIYSVIEGIAIKEIVFTYCFKTIGNGDREEDENVREIKLGMPKKLTTRLKDKLSQNYILETFRKKGDIIDECEKKEGYGPDINVYEYIIQGEIEPHQETDEYEVTVEIVMTDKKGRETLVEGFREKYSPVFFENLAERIMNEWQRIMNERPNKRDK
jgi:TolB-like protein